MLRKFLLLLFLVTSLIAWGQQSPLWLRYPSISPDGSTIAFCYKGNLYAIPSEGGLARPLTVGAAYKSYPVWSHDGKTIAFAGNYYGNFDIFAMSSEGGSVKRLTWNSAADYPYDFSIDDKQVIFGTYRNDVTTSLRFPINIFQKLYSVPVSGGRSRMLLSAGTENVHYSPDGNSIVFQDRKGYEDAFRKHHTSSVTRDIWTYNFLTGTYKKISDYKGEDREPIYSPDGNYIYYLSERNGSQNLFKYSLLDGGLVQLTFFTLNPVRNLSVSRNGILCFTYNGEIYTLKEGEKPQKLPVDIREAVSDVPEVMPIAGGLNQFALSPNGKEFAFIVHGEVFVSSTDGSMTKQITHSARQERMVNFSPDGKTLYYSVEMNGSWDVYKANIIRKDEPYFYASTLIKETPVIATDKDEFQSLPSPDGKKIAYLEERNIVKVLDLATGEKKTILPAGQNFSYADGDQYFSWSPDSRWLAISDAQGYFANGSHSVLFNTTGNSTSGVDITPGGFGSFNEKWAMGGKAILYESGRNGLRSLSSSGGGQSDIYIQFFDQSAYDRFRLNKTEDALLKEQEGGDTSHKKAVFPIFNPDFNNLTKRLIRLTATSADIDDYALSTDGEKLFYIIKGQDSYELWTLNTRTRDQRLLTNLPAGGQLEMSKDGKALFVLAGGNLLKIDPDAGKVSPVAVTGEMVVDHAEERTYIFNHIINQVAKKLYDPTIHGLDWKGYYKTNYARFLPYINNNYDFQEMLSELLGELNVSHTGARYYARFPHADETASLGLLYDESLSGNGLKVTEVLSGGPCDKAGLKIKVGNIIEKIDGNAIDSTCDWAEFLNRKSGRFVVLDLYDPVFKSRWQEKVKTVTASDEHELLYQRWLKKMSQETEKLSHGKIGYVYIRSMDDASFRDVFEKVLGENRAKQALIVDSRFNGGGWLHNDLVTFLSGHSYLKFAPYGFSSKGGEPDDRWSRPSCVLMSECNYSDAYLFPYSYRANGIGKLIGMPVAGTGTAVWWERQIDPTLIFGIPMIATIGSEKRPTENLQLEPDIKVENPYPDILNGQDDQLKAAVSEMLRETSSK